MAWLLDTNVLSELRRPKPEPRVVAFIAGQPMDQLYVSEVTLAEIRFGIELVAQPDLIIAATALHHGHAVVTRDRSEYDLAGVPVMNPWDAP